MSAALETALVGCGRVAERLYLPALARVRGLRLAAAIDPLPERRRAIAAAVPGCRELDPVAGPIDPRAFAVAIVATPPRLHAAAARPFVDAGLPVLIEKPLAPTLAEALDLAEAATASGARVAVGFNRRFWEPARELARRLATAPAGRRASAHLVMTSDAAGWAPLGGIEDALDDLGSHQLDLLRFVLRAEPVAVRAARSAGGVVLLELRLDDGSEAVCESAQRAPSSETFELTLDGRRFVARMGSDRVAPPPGLARALYDFNDRIAGRLLRRRSSLRRSYELQFEELAAVGRGEREPSADLADGLAVLRATAAARQSMAAAGRWVTIEPAGIPGGSAAKEDRKP
jgi:predicted dehydrogenase